jgi:hypothetical protein
MNTSSTTVKDIQAVTLGSQEATGNTLTKLAPNWFQDGVAERVQQGASQELAIKAMQATPFFQKEWVA